MTQYGLSLGGAEHREKLIKLLIYIGLAAGIFAAYEPIRHNGFVSYDDKRYIVDNGQVKSGITWNSMGQAFTKPHFFMWHPLTTISHTLDYQLFGLNPLGHHIVSVLLHTANALLLFWILVNITGSIWPSAFVAAVFALHPLQVESVAWAAERKTVLSGFFWFLTIAIYIWYARQQSIGRYILLFAVYTLCIMTKPIVVTLPFVLLLLDYWPLERLQWGQSIKTVLEKTQGHKISAGRLIIEKIPLLALSVFLSAATFVTQRSGGGVISLEKIALDYRVANMLLSYIRYIGKTIWPSRLAVYYPYTKAAHPGTEIVVCALLLVLVTALCIYIGRRRKYTAVGWLWYVGTLVPMIGLVQSGTQSMANRYMYISMLGLLIIVTWAVKDLIASRPRWKIVVAVLAAMVLCSAVVVTRIQVSCWQNSLTLFEHALKVTKNNSIAEMDYGCALADIGCLREAELHLNNAVRIDPEFSLARSNLGIFLLKQGRLGEAAARFNELLQQNKDSAEAHYNLGVALSMQKKYDDAIKHLAKALEINPEYPNARCKIGTALMMAGRWNEAITCFNEALQTSTDRMEVYVNLAIVYSRLGNNEQSLQNCGKAMELKSDNSEVLNNLAWLLTARDNTTVEDAGKAVGFAQRACELTAYKEAEKLDTLAVAYAAAGRFPDAVMTAEKALKAAKAAGKDDLAREIQNRLELYQTGRSYRGK